jgi:F-type H+-transporting ATPase subunit b
LEALGLNLGYLIVQILNFIIIFLILSAFAYKPLLNLLNERRKRIAQGLEDAKIAAEARENAEQEAAEIIAKAQADAAERMRESTERAVAAEKEIIAEAEKESAKIRQDAVTDANQERERILAEVRGQIAALSMAAAQRLIGEALDEKRQRALIEEFFSGVKSGKVVVLEDFEATGASAEITSAVPLTDQEKDTIRKDIISKAGSQTVSFRVDPAILGGLVVKIGDKVLDGSVSGKMENMRQSLS